MCDWLKRMFAAKRVINISQCPNCHQWDHQADVTWVSKAYDGGPDVVEKVCECGYTSRWTDTGFMGLLACTDARKPATGWWDGCDPEVIHIHPPLKEVEA